MTISLTYPPGSALVTGGTGRVGEGIVRRLAAAGLPLVFTYRDNAERAAALEAELRATGHRVSAQAMDMTDVGSIRAALERTAGEYGPLHTVACGSGVPVRFNRLADFPIDEVEQFIFADALGYYRVFHEAIPMLRANGGGTITTCSTVATHRVIAYDGMSPLSKGSVEALVRQLAAEEAEHNVRLNCVGITWCETRTAEEARACYPPTDPANPTTQDERTTVLMNQMMRIVRLGRPATPLEAGDLFAFLASQQASFLTGHYIALDGGALL